MDRVQLGTIHLDLRAPDANTVANPTWFALTPQFINAGLLTNFSSSEELVALLAELLLDPGISFQAECQVAHPHLVVRCSLIPSDGRGGNWRNRPVKDRGRALRKLFGSLQDVWDREGNWVLARKVSLRRIQAKAQEEDSLKIHKLYSLIPSPAAPAVEDWRPSSAGDFDSHGRIMRGDDLKGINTVLYKYQLVGFQIRSNTND